MNSNTVTSGEVRLSYCNLFQPFAVNATEEPQYSVTALIPKTDSATLYGMSAAIEAAKAAGMSSKWDGRIPPVLDITLRDGDGPRPSDGEPYGPECRGHMVLKCKTKQKPFVVDQNVQDIIDPSKVYSGCYGRVNVTFIPYNNNGKKGITCLLNGVQLLRDGEPLAGGVTAAEAFGPAPVNGAMPAAPGYSAPGYAPTAPSYPQQPAPAYGASTYPQQAAYTAPAPGYPQYTVDPITGQPVAPQGYTPTGTPIMGL
ncbi:MAG: ssDNA-binding protein [Lawsonibacter sp.]